MRSEVLLTLLLASGVVAMEDTFSGPLARPENAPLRPAAPRPPPTAEPRPAPAQEQPPPSRPAGEGPEDPKAVDANEIPARQYIHAKPRPPRRVESREGLLVSPSDRVDANDALQEIVDEFAADIARIGASNVSPILIDRIRVSDNLNPEFAQVLEARLVSAIHAAAKVAVLRCVECNATQGRVEEGHWVVSRGFSNRDDLRRIAGHYKAQIILNGMLSLYTSPNSMAFDVELIRAEDASIAFAEGYRVHPHTAMLYRSSDRAMAREARLKDLEDRINARPRFNNAVQLGVTVIPSDHPDGVIWASVAGFRFLELFGTEREWRIGGDLSVFLNPLRLTAAVPMLQAQRRITPDNVYLPTCHVGAAAGMFVSGLEGNSPAFGLNGECIFAHRIGVQASLKFIIPTRLGGATGYFAGGFTPHLGAAYQW